MKTLDTQHAASNAPVLEAPGTHEPTWSEMAASSELLQLVDSGGGLIALVVILLILLVGYMLFGVTVR